MRHTGRLCEYMAQAMAAEAICHELEVYALSIGCKVFQDELVCDDKQARLLSAWWSDRTAAQ